MLFPKEDFIIQGSNSILVENVDCEYETQILSNNHYKTLTEVFIKTRRKDYFKAQRS